MSYSEEKPVPVKYEIVGTLLLGPDLMAVNKTSDGKYFIREWRRIRKNKKTKSTFKVYLSELLTREEFEEEYGEI